MGRPMKRSNKAAVTSLKERQRAIRAQAARLQGSKEAGDQWLSTPAIGLSDKRVPKELLRSRKGAGEVEDLLMRLERGVYS